MYVQIIYGVKIFRLDQLKYIKLKVLGLYTTAYTGTKRNIYILEQSEIFNTYIAYTTRTCVYGR